VSAERLCAAVKLEPSIALRAEVGAQGSSHWCIHLQTRSSSSGPTCIKPLWFPPGALQVPVLQGLHFDLVVHLPHRALLGLLQVGAGARG
jgi:hypothetical protein